MVVTMEGNHILVTLKDQKCLLLIELMYPMFLGHEKDSRKDSAKNSRNPKGGDSGVDSGSESEEDNTTTDSESKETTEKNNMFAGDIWADEMDRGVFAIGAGGAEDPPRRNASYLGGKELEPLFAHCTHHYSFPLQKII